MFYNYILLEVCMINLTDSAIQKIKSQLQAHEGFNGVRFGVEATGCSGFAYTVSFAKQHGDTDSIIKRDGFFIYINDESLEYIKDMTVDYVKKDFSEGFEFINPNEAARCGCGESFTI